MRHRIAFPFVLVCAIAACGDPPSAVEPGASEPASLKRGGAPRRAGRGPSCW